MAGFQQGAFQALANVKWTSGGYVVVTTSRSHHQHGNGVPGAPPIFLNNISEWDNYYNEFDINADGIRRTFPGNESPPPKRKDLSLTLSGGQPNLNVVLRWGGFDQPDYGGGGGVGAERVRRPKPVLVGAPYPPNFEADGYTDGKVIHDLVVFNVPPIKLITGKDDFEFSLDFPSVDGIPDPGNGGVTSRTLWFVWGSGARLTNDIFPFDFPVFPPASGGTTGYPNYNALHPVYKFQGLQSVAQINVVNTWILNNINTGLPDAEYPPIDTPGQPNGPGSQAIVQAQVDFANRTFGPDGGPTFFLASGIEYFTSGPPLEQPETSYDVTVAYYTKPPNNFPEGSSGPNDVVPFFPVDPQNNPLWDQNKADQKVTRTFGGSAPQAGRSLKVKLARNPQTGKQVLTANLTVEP